MESAARNGSGRRQPSEPRRRPCPPVAASPTQTCCFIPSISSDAVKREKAREWIDYLWRTGEGRLSWQVLNEFYANASRKMSVPAAEAREAVTIFSQWRPAGISMAVFDRAWHWMDRAQLSWWDSLILASAERLGCRWLLSEDFQSGRNYEGITVINPFEQTPGVHASAEFMPRV